MPIAHRALQTDPVAALVNGARGVWTASGSVPWFGAWPLQTARIINTAVSNHGPDLEFNPISARSISTSHKIYAHRSVRNQISARSTSTSHKNQQNLSASRNFSISLLRLYNTSTILQTHPRNPQKTPMKCSKRYDTMNSSPFPHAGFRHGGTCGGGGDGEHSRRPSPLPESPCRSASCRQ